MNISICRQQGFHQRTCTANCYIHMKSQNQTLLPQQCAMMDQTSYPLFPLSYEQPSENPFNRNIQKHLVSVLATKWLDEYISVSYLMVHKLN